jgi:hypothetical protein
LIGLGLNADRQELGAVFAKMDTDHDGKISEGEFSTIVRDWIETHSKEKVKARSVAASARFFLVDPYAYNSSDSDPFRVKLLTSCFIL